MGNDLRENIQQQRLRVRPLRIQVSHHRFQQVEVLILQPVHGDHPPFHALYPLAQRAVLPLQFPAV